MSKTIHTLASVILTAAVLLTGCTARPVRTIEPVERTESVSYETTSRPQPLRTEPESAQPWDIALPMDFPQTTQEEQTQLSERSTQTEPQTTAAATTTTTAATTTTTTTATTMTAKTTAATTKTAKTTTAPAVKTAGAKTAAATTAAAAKTTAANKQTAAPSDAKAVLNRAALHPQKTNDAELDNAVQQVFDRIFTPGMTTYDKVRACYDYIIQNAEYGRPKMVVTQDDLNAYQKEQDAWIVLFSKRILTNGQGVCDDYSALFLVMMRAIGLDCYYTHGCTTNTKGEKKDHVWDTITVNGVDYIFDPQVEDKQSANGIQYTFFCKTYDSSIAKIYSDYDLAADKAAYNAFRKG